MKIKNIHFVGIKGVGMTPLAIIAKEAGCHVTGSDIKDEFITDELLRKARIKVYPGFSSEHIDSPDLVITTGAHGGFSNVEVLEAKKKGIPVISQGEAVGDFMEGSLFGRQFSGISVAGSHGKTTTAALIATVLKSEGMDPSYLIGTGMVPSLGSNGHFGKGEFFVAEADEYVTDIGSDHKAKLLWQHPKIAVITNIEFDHPDVFESQEKLVEVFLQFANQLPADGLLVACGDDDGSYEVLRQHTGRSISYGFSPKNDYVIKRSYTSEPYTFFNVEAKGVNLGEFAVGLSGEHNALNSLAGIIVGLEVGLSLEQIKKGLKKFTGSKRRSEFLGYTKDGAMVFDDYAHHPTEIKKTLTAFRKRFPSSKIICIFQPHMYSRTKKLFEQFVESFSDADTVILTDIYPSLREEPDPSVSSKLLSEKIAMNHKGSLYLSSLDDVVKYVNKSGYPQNAILISMGAGDVYKIASSIVDKKV